MKCKATNRIFTAFIYSEVNPFLSLLLKCYRMKIGLVAGGSYDF